MQRRTFCFWTRRLTVVRSWPTSSVMICDSISLIQPSMSSQLCSYSTCRFASNNFSPLPAVVPSSSFHWRASSSTRGWISCTTSNSHSTVTLMTRKGVQTTLAKSTSCKCAHLMAALIQPAAKCWVYINLWEDQLCRTTSYTKHCGKWRFDPSSHLRDQPTNRNVYIM